MMAHMTFTIARTVPNNNAWKWMVYF